jgi:hypothetical protein
MRFQALAPLLSISCLLASGVIAQTTCTDPVSTLSKDPHFVLLTQLTGTCQSTGLTGNCITKENCASGLNDGLVGFYVTGACPDGKSTSWFEGITTNENV